MEVAVGNGHGFHHVGVFLFHYAPQTVEVVIKAVVITRSPRLLQNTTSNNKTARTA